MSEKGGVYRIVAFIVIIACLLAVGMVLYDGWDKLALSRQSDETEETGDIPGEQNEDADGLLEGGAALPSTGADYASALPPIADIAEAVSPAVVRIDVTKTVSQSPEENFGIFGDIFRNFGDYQYEQQGSGSGFIISADGYIVTNHHVIDGMNEIKVTLLDGRTYDAKLIGSYSAYDIAVIKVEASGLPYAVLGSSKDLRPGEWVVAIGNPHGFEHTVTAGIVSAIERNLANVEGAEDISQAELIQTDAAINSGNSGGPLINMDGKIVGINTAIIPYAQGISFAISIDSVKDAIQSLKQTGKYARPWIGIWYYPLDADAAEQLGIKETSGIYVADVADGSPASRAGIKTGDIIKAFEGVSTEGKFNLALRVREKQIGENVKLTILRNGKRMDLTLTLSAAPEGE